MSTPLARLMALMGDQQPFESAEAAAQAELDVQSIDSSGPIGMTPSVADTLDFSTFESILSISSPSTIHSQDLAPYEYVDPAEQNIVDGIEVLKGLLLSDDRIGTLAPRGLLLSPFWTIKNLVVNVAKACNPSFQQQALRETMAEFWKSEWTLYYLCAPPEFSPLMMVSTADVLSFFQQLKVKDPYGGCSEGTMFPPSSAITFNFERFPFASPRYLGTTHSEMALDILHDALIKGKVKRVVDFYQDQVKYDNFTNSTSIWGKDSELQKFKMMINTIKKTNLEGHPLLDAEGQPMSVNAGRNEASGLSSEGSNQRASRLARQNAAHKSNAEEWCRAFRRAQRYLGLRPLERLPDQTGSILHVEEPSLDYNAPPTYPFDQDVIFLSLDIEADEENQDIVTEVGLAALDTRKLHHSAPGFDARNWFKKIAARHFRIAEQTHIRNHRFVDGDPAAFNPAFGKSEFVPLAKVADLVRSCFEVEDQSLDTDKDVPGNASLRNIILIGHSVKGDIRWLKKIGLDILTLNNITEVLTTENLQKALKHNRQGGTSVAKMLEEMSIPAQDLHNAGNDAVYTLQAFLAMATRGLCSTRPMVSLNDRIRMAMQKAKEEAEAEYYLWTEAEVQSRDGQKPVPWRFSSLRG